MPLSPTAPTVPFGALLVAHRVVGICLLFLGDFLNGLPHFERAIELYDPVEHRPLATLFGADTRAHALCYRSWTFWFLGHPKAAILDACHAVHGARENGPRWHVDEYSGAHPYLHFLVYHSVRSSLLGRGAVRRPRPSTRAPRGIFCCKPASARMQRLAIGGGVTIGIVACSDEGEDPHGWLKGSAIPVCYLDRLGWPSEPTGEP